MSPSVTKSLPPSQPPVSPPSAGADTHLGERSAKPLTLPEPELSDCPGLGTPGDLPGGGGRKGGWEGWARLLPGPEHARMRRPSADPATCPGTPSAPPTHTHTHAHTTSPGRHHPGLSPGLRQGGPQGHSWWKGPWATSASLTAPLWKLRPKKEESSSEVQKGQLRPLPQRLARAPPLCVTSPQAHA